jgi:hypothetical protein
MEETAHAADDHPRHNAGAVSAHVPASHNGRGRCRNARASHNPGSAERGTGSGLEYLIFGLLSNFAVCRKLNIPDLTPFLMYDLLD